MYGSTDSAFRGTLSESHYFASSSKGTCKWPVAGLCVRCVWVPVVEGRRLSRVRSWNKLGSWKRVFWGPSYQFARNFEISTVDHENTKAQECVQDSINPQCHVYQAQYDGQAPRFLRPTSHLSCLSNSLCEVIKAEQHRASATESDRLAFAEPPPTIMA